MARAGAERAPRPESSSGRAVKPNPGVRHLGFRWLLWSLSCSGASQDFRAGNQPGWQIPTQLGAWQPRGLFLTFRELVSGVRTPEGGGQEADSVATVAPELFQKYLSKNKIKIRWGSEDGQKKGREL